MKITPSKKILTFFFYAIPFLAILTWWTFAFKYNEAEDTFFVVQSQTKKKSPPVLKYLSPMQREVLHGALSGNYKLMIKLITDWDHDAQIMEQFGFSDIKRLSRNDFLRCQLLARQINNSTHQDLELLRDYYRMEYVKDDNGNLFDLSKSYRRFLPQSYVAASFLLALSEPESIVALPKGMREQKQIYPVELTRLITLDTDRYNTEKFYEAAPEIAFVADYSHPSTIQALKKQGIPLFTLKQINSPEDIKNALITIGNGINRPLEAELLNYFVESAMQAIENRFKILNTAFNNDSPKVLFLKHHLTFSTPTGNTLTGKLLKRIGVNMLVGDTSINNSFTWSVPFHQEQILEMKPDYIIIAANNPENCKRNILKDHLFQTLLNDHETQLAFVDNAIQECPSQYMVLAYFDIFEALCGHP